eukprot:TRINITY_DN55592_c0_g1_i1.p1 TRINITY_DN55592_c0_g1~~TRINITY_DN55592_c0_g1_i1.p1  ORF type:complete len:747 (-),score=123.88 TRINITY_DN55592_c0_g1_i1:118-2169(-)
MLGDNYVVLKPGTILDIVNQVYKEQVSKGGGGGDSDDEDFDDGMDDDDIDDDDEEVEDGAEMSSALTADIRHVKERWGEKAIEIRDFRTLDQVQVDLNIDVSALLNNYTAEAWGVARTEPIIATLHVARTSYLDNVEPPKVECAQKSRACPLASQLQNIINLFLKLLWSKSDAELEEHYADGPHSRPQHKSSSSNLRTTSGRKQQAQVQQQSSGGGGLGSFFGMGGKKQKFTKKEQEMIKILSGMGFAQAAIERAVKMTSSVEEAANLLATDDLDEEDDMVVIGTGTGGGGSGPPGISRDMELLTGGAPSATDFDTNKAIPRRGSGGFLVQLMEYALHRIPTCSSYCVICDKTHMFASGAMMKPAVCSRELCAFAFQQLKVGADAAEDIAAETGVVDLLVCMARAAAFSGRAQDILVPYPQVVDPENPRKMVLTPSKPDIPKVQKIFEAFPPVQALAQANDVQDMKLRLDAKEPLAYPLLQWIVTSNRSHLVKLKDETQLKTMSTHHQYLLVTEPPEKQKRFSELKAKYGSKFAFHGSPIENWHAILRDGLKNASSTKLQLHGAAHGAGIYLAPQASTSYGYANKGGTAIPKKFANQSGGTDILGMKFLDESQMLCMALCEVINHDIKDCGWAWVAPQADYVSTRFLFVYDSRSSSGPKSEADCSKSEFQREIQSALEKNGLA